MEEKISSELKLAELKRESFRQSIDQLHDRASSIISLTLQWKDIEDHFASIQNAIDERATELHLIQDSVEKKSEEVQKRECRWNVVHNERLREIEAREKELELIRMNMVEERERDFLQIEKSKRELGAVSESIERKLILLEEKESRIGLLNDSIDKKRSQIKETEAQVSQALKEIEAKEEQYEQSFDKLKLKEKQVEEEFKIVALNYQNIGRSLVELEVKEKKLEEERKELKLKAEKFKNLESKEKQCEQSFHKLKLKEKQVEEQSKMLALKDENFSRLLLELEEKENKLEEERKELGLKAEQFKDLELKEEQSLDELKLKEKQVEQSRILALKDETISRLLLELEMKEKKLGEERKELGLETEKFKDLESKEKLVQASHEEVESEKKKYMERCKEVEMKEEQLNKRLKEFELKESHFVEGQQNPCGVNYDKDYTDANIHFTVISDGKALQIFLNEHCGEYDSKRNDVFIALGISSDPAKLVLDAMEGFYPPHLENGGKQFEGRVVRRSCILLLAQLRKISTVISPPVKKKAMKLAFDWMTKMKLDAQHSLEILGFFQLLVTYGLTSAFDADELLTRLEIVAQHNQAPELFCLLGFADKIPGFIRNLIRKKQYIGAIRFICAFELVSEFPPVPLLNEYLKDSENAAKKLTGGINSLEGQIEATNRRIADLSCAIRCIEDCKIEYRPNLKIRAEFLEKKNSERKANLANLGHEVQKKEHLACTIPAMDASILAPVNASASPLSCFPTTASVTNNQSQQLSGNMRSLATMSAEDSLNTCHDDNQATCTIPFLGKFEQSSLCDLPLESNKASALKPERNPNKSSVNASKVDLKQLMSMLETHRLQDDEIAAVIQSASDPGKLVLDVINVSFNLEGNKDLKSCIPKKSCIFLLEQLRKVSPPMNTEIKNQAKTVSLNWKNILAKNRNGPLEVICFLQFLAAYRLASIFKADELLSLLETDNWCKEAPDLCQVLGLADKIPSFIEDHIKNSQHLEAVKYIYAFDIIDRFPPVPILKDYLILSNASKKRSKSIGGEIVNISKEIESLKSVIKCIADFKITGLSTESLKQRIVKLEKQKEDKLLIEASKDRTRSFSSSNSKFNQQVSKASASTTTISAYKTRVPKWSGYKRRRIHYSERPSLRRRSGLFGGQDVPCLNAPHGEHSLAAYPPYNMGLNSYGPSVIPSYHWTAFGNPGHDRPPLPF